MTNKNPAITFSSNRVFQYVLARHPDVTKEILELLTKRHISKVEYTLGEHVPITDIFKSKTVRFDVYTKDSNNVVFDVEMQVQTEASLGKRLRYYQSQLDSSLLKEGENYNKLKETYIIFICMKSPFDTNLAEYVFEPVCLEDKSANLLSNMHWLVINVSAYDRISATDKRLSYLLEYMYDNKRNDDKLVEKIDSIVTNFTDNEVSSMVDAVLMDTWDRENLLEAAEERGRAEGLARGIAKGEARYAKLAAKLANEGRLGDLQEASVNPKYRNKLFAEFGL